MSGPSSKDVVRAFNSSILELDQSNPTWESDAYGGLLSDAKQNRTAQRYSFRKMRRSRRDASRQIQQAETVANKLGLPEVASQIKQFVGSVPSIPMVSWSDMFYEAAAAADAGGGDIYY